MTALLTSLLGDVWPYVVAGAATIGALLMAYLKGRGAERAKQTEKRLEDIKVARQVEDQVRAEPVEKRREELSKWER